jgi:hypothetical protein
MMPIKKHIKRIAHLYNEMTKRTYKTEKDTMLRLVTMLSWQSDEPETVTNYGLSQNTLVNLETMEQILHTPKLNKTSVQGVDKPAHIPQ